MAFLRKNQDKSAPLGAFGPATPKAPGKTPPAPPKTPATATPKTTPPKSPAPPAPVAPKAPAAPIQPAAKAPAPVPVAPNTTAPKPPVAKQAVTVAPAPKPAAPKPVAPAAPISKTSAPPPIQKPSTPVAPQLPVQAAPPAAPPKVVPPTIAPAISQPVQPTKPEPAWQPIEFDLEPELTDTKPELPDVSAPPAETDSDSTSFEDQIIADALAEDALADTDVPTETRNQHALTEDDLVEHPAEAAVPEEFLADNAPADEATEYAPVIEAELLPADPFANRAMRASAFSPAADQPAEPTAAPTGFSGWLRSRPKWFWVAVVVGWLIAAAVIAAVKKMPSTRSADEWELIRKAYLKKEAEKAAAQSDGANQPSAPADGAKNPAEGAKNPAGAAPKTPADSPAK